MLSIQKMNDSRRFINLLNHKGYAGAHAPLPLYILMLLHFQRFWMSTSLSPPSKTLKVVGGYADIYVPGGLHNLLYT